MYIRDNVRQLCHTFGIFNTDQARLQTTVSELGSTARRHRSAAKLGITAWQHRSATPHIDAYIVDELLNTCKQLCYPSRLIYNRSIEKAYVHVAGYVTECVLQKNTWRFPFWDVLLKRDRYSLVLNHSY